MNLQQTDALIIGYRSRTYNQAKVVLWCLQCSAQNNGTLATTISELATLCSLSYKQIRLALEVLQSAEDIVVKRLTRVGVLIRVNALHEKYVCDERDNGLFTELFTTQTAECNDAYLQGTTASLN